MHVFAVSLHVKLERKHLSVQSLNLGLVDLNVYLYNGYEDCVFCR